MFEDVWSYPATRYDPEGARGGKSDCKVVMVTSTHIRMGMGVEEEMWAHYPELFEDWNVKCGIVISVG